MENETNVLENKIVSTYSLRKKMASSFAGFCGTYLSHYLDLDPADFHPELIELLENQENKFLSICGFRGSAKSSFAGLALPLWLALEYPEIAPFIITVNETDDVGKITIANLREELETNDLLRNDYGEAVAIKRGSTKFTETNIVLANGVRIMSRSRGQKIRGLRHKQFRPKVVIVDDAEELEKVQKKEYRDKTEHWLTSAIIPSIEEAQGRLIVIGNMLHTDSLMARLKKNPLFIHRDYPLIKGEEIWKNCTWKAKYPTPEALKLQEQKVRFRSVWLREYLLKVVPPEGQEVQEEWIKRYKSLPEMVTNAAVGVDLAISKKDTADFTSMVSGIASIVEGQPKIYILPNPINHRLTFLETIQQMKAVHDTVKLHCIPTFFVENVGYQKAAIEEARRNMLAVKEVKPSADKRARLRTAATFIQNGTVVFPEKGCEDLIGQMLNFGVEDHDDLVDAFVYLVLGLAEVGIQKFEVIKIT